MPTNLQAGADERTQETEDYVGKKCLIPCKINRSGFPSERIFQIEKMDESFFTGAAPERHDLIGAASPEYFYLAHGSDYKKIEKNQPGPGETLCGFVTARIVSLVTTNVCVVHVPSGDVFYYDLKNIESIEKTTHVFVKS